VEGDWCSAPALLPPTTIYQSPIAAILRPSPFRAGLAAARANLIPGLFIQAAVLGVLLAYWYHEPSRAFLGRVAEWKSTYGYPFTFALVSLAGAVLPEFLRIVIFQRGRPRMENIRNVGFGIPFWGFMGICADTLYRAQALWFGNEATPSVVLYKVLFDQLVYTPLFGTSAIVWAYEWRRHSFAFDDFRYAFTPGFYRERILPSLIAGWGVWVPTITLVYCLPSLLQLPVSALATCFWSLLVVYIQSAKPNAAA
jgi:hypothetical protein